jgi:hypothetical protein
MPLWIPEGEYVTAVEAPELLSITKSSISALCNEGKLPSIRSVGLRLILLQDVLDRKTKLADSRRAELERLIGDDP